jgi:hypothetical protein
VATPPSIPLPAKPPTAPGGVQGLLARPGSTMIFLSWTPAPDGGSPLLGHHVVCTGTGTAWTGTVDVPGSATAATVVRVANGVDYTCAVVARNALGDGPAVTTTVRPDEPVPGAPVNVRADVGDHTIVVHWSPPTSGAAPVQQYAVTVDGGTLGGSATGGVPASQTSSTITGWPVNGVPYTVRVAALAASGAAGPSTSAPAPVTPAGPPGAPQAVALSGGSQTIDVRWRAAAANGSPLTGYVVTAEPGGHRLQLPPDASTATLGGFVNGYGITPDTDYTVTVVATNGVGAGPPSAPKTVRLAAPVISSFTVRSTGGSALEATFSIDWKGSTDNGCAFVVTGGPSDLRYSFAPGLCGLGTYQLDPGLYDTTLSISLQAAYVTAEGRGQVLEKGPIVLRTPRRGP